MFQEVDTYDEKIVINYRFQNSNDFRALMRRKIVLPAN